MDDNATSMPHIGNYSAALPDRHLDGLLLWGVTDLEAPTASFLSGLQVLPNSRFFKRRRINGDQPIKG